MLKSSRNILIDTPRNNTLPVFGHPLFQSSWNIKLTITDIFPGCRTLDLWVFLSHFFFPNSALQGWFIVFHKKPDIAYHFFLFFVFLMSLSSLCFLSVSLIFLVFSSVTMMCLDFSFSVLSCLRVSKLVLYRSYCFSSF